MLQAPFTMGDLIKHMDSEEVKKLFSNSQIEIIKDAIKHRWTFTRSK